jgi:ATP-dependent DNA ligase
MNKEICEGLQLATTVTMDKVKFPCYAEVKVDGVRCFLYCGVFYTRQSNVLPFRTFDSLKELCADQYCLDMEISFESRHTADRSAIAGMCNSVQHYTKVDESKLRLNIFDILPVVDYNARQCKDGYLTRKQQIRDLLVNNTDTRVTVVQEHPIANIAEVQRYYSMLVQDGFEGLVVKQANDKYQFKRSKQWLRFKQSLTADLKCIDVLGGTGKYTGMIGALVLKGIVEGKMVTVSVGSGLTDYDRAQPIEAYLNKTIEVVYNTTSENSLLLPRFSCVRFDK